MVAVGFCLRDHFLAREHTLDGAMLNNIDPKCAYWLLGLFSFFNGEGCFDNSYT